ncbi:PIG-L deacetylase family protein [Actinoplanes sp. OR16]|uniref:PIG-L deacetylase family protein n=1 Tax=Actinoplanes sp. OR16 TaxID=946334 RepID=UPI000FDBBF0C|nr:PIG-L family deacetylase [Actinoplanes sp. OR16]
MKNLGTILGIWAHPDDEAYLSGGLMALATEAGERVVCVTATRGELSADPGQRTAELHACLKILGVTEHHWFDYRDGECSRVPPSAAIARLQKIIARVRPDTIVSFGPDGNTGHPDHQAVARWAEAATPPGTRLLQTAVPDDWATRWKTVNERFQVFQPGYPVTSPESELAVHLTLEPPVLDRKVRALTAQATQTAGLIAAMGADFASWVADEAFVESGG